MRGVRLWVLGCWNLEAGPRGRGVICNGIAVEGNGKELDVDIEDLHGDTDWMSLSSSGDDEANDGYYFDYSRWSTSEHVCYLSLVSIF